MKKVHINLLLLALCAVARVACQDEGGPKFSVQLKENATLGKILTDKKGFTLYFFSDDTKGISTCTGDCLTFWPVA